MQHAFKLDVVNLTCERGDLSLFTGLSFELAAGELMQVQGANGAGKTTLLRTLCGFIQPVEGVVKWNGQDISEWDDGYHAQMCYLGHLNAIKDELSALENLQMGAGLAGFKVSEQEAVNVLRRMGLRRKEHLPVRVLSQGQRRRVALSRLLIGDAKLWILDEPLTALDVGAVALMQELIGEHLSNGGMTIFTTHQPLQVAGVQTRELVLS
ncbi:MAG: cytochrome c biogenesis heme-transporting ATPase CcmA [Sideroxydans sp.]|nr:cytochrome c biogenesis heme-transporting ATPase CcmA [Sideroxydans sp.]NOT99905.1 cytochrome c biogenesis heme-transporting ATPase CcmA [Sideroxydans sp.]